ncbi:MAG TPA: hypothetical protein VKB56_08945 [Terriglobales bacterium]|nr:hypothetical protein [Terriglobales bacterium]
MLLRTRSTVAIAILALAACQVCLAQYSGGTMGTTSTGSPVYTAPSGGYKTNGAMIGALVGGGAAAAGGVYFLMHHRNMYTGCVGPDGKTLVRQKDGTSFQLKGTSLTPGEKVALKAKKSADEEVATLEVQDVKKDYGACEQVAKK